MSEMTYSRGSLALDYVRALLGLGIVGGLLLFTTPVVYLYLDRLSRASRTFWHTRIRRTHVPG